MPTHFHNVPEFYPPSEHVGAPPPPLHDPGAQLTAEQSIAATMSESYARKLRDFMEERAHERAQSQKRVAQLEAVLGAYGSGRKPSFGSPLMPPTGGPHSIAGPPAPPPNLGAAGPSEGGCAATFGTPPPRNNPRLSVCDTEGGSYTQRLAQLAAERDAEEARHREELSRLRMTQQGIGRELAAPFAEAEYALEPADLPQPMNAAFAATAAASNFADAAAQVAHAENGHMPSLPFSNAAAGGGGGRDSMRQSMADAWNAEGEARLRAARAEEMREQQREQQRTRVAELQRHISVLSSGGVTSQLGKARLARLQEELQLLNQAVNRISPPPGEAHPTACASAPHTPTKKEGAVRRSATVGATRATDPSGLRSAMPPYNPMLDSAAPPRRVMTASVDDEAVPPTEAADRHYSRYDGAAGGEAYDGPPHLTAAATAATALLAPAASRAGSMPPIAPGAEQWWAGSVESRRAKDAARDSLLLAGGALDGTDALAERAAAWKAERAKLVEGHAALARRLASEVEARESVHTKLLSAEARAGMVDALEKSAKDANARSDALQQRIDTLVGSLETRDEEARQMQAAAKAAAEANEAVRAEEAQAMAALRERLAKAQEEQTAVSAARSAVSEEAETLKEQMQKANADLASARSEGAAAAIRAAAAEEEAAEHEASLRRQEAAEEARVAAEAAREAEMEEQLAALSAQRDAAAEAAAVAASERTRDVAALEERLSDAEGHASHLAKELGTARGSLQAAQHELQDATGAVAAAQARALSAEEAAEARASEVGRLQAAGGIKDADMAALRARVAEADAEASEHAKASASARALAEEQRRRADGALSARSEGEGEWRSRAEAATALAERLEAQLESQAKAAEKASAAAAERLAAVEGTATKSNRDGAAAMAGMEEAAEAVKEAEEEAAAAKAAAAEATGAATQAGMKAAAAEAKAAQATEAAAASDAALQRVNADKDEAQERVRELEASLRAAKAGAEKAGANAAAAAELAEAVAAAEAEARAAAAAEAKADDAADRADEADARLAAVEVEAKAAAESAKRRAAEAKAEAAAEKARLAADLAEAEVRAAAAEAKLGAAEAGGVGGTNGGGADGEKAFELRLLVDSQQSELAQARIGWATHAMHAALSTSWTLRTAAAIGAWRSAVSAIAAAGSGTAALEAAAARAAPGKENAENDALDGRIAALQDELSAARAATDAAAKAAAAESKKHADELDEAEASSRKRLARASRLVQTQCKDASHARLGWATSAVGAHLLTRYRLDAAWALHRWSSFAVSGSRPDSQTASGGAAAAAAVAESRELAREAMAEQQLEVRMLVGSLQCAAVRSLLRRSRCEDECEMRRSMRAWRYATGGGGAQKGKDAYYEGMTV